MKTRKENEIVAIKNIIGSLYSLQNSLRALAPDFKWAGLGNLLGDYGEYVAINHYKLKKAPPGSDGFDAKTRDEKTVQIKTNHAASMIGYRGEADLMLVIHVSETGEWEEIYFGDFQKVKNQSNFSKRDNKNTITMSKLKQLQKKYHTKIRKNT